MVGPYHLYRSVAIAPAALLGGLLWRTSPALPFYVAAAVGAVVVVEATVDETHAA